MPAPLLTMPGSCIWKKPSWWGKLLSCAAVVLLHVLCLKCATSVADETVKVSQAHPGSRWVLAAGWGTCQWPLHEGFSRRPCHTGQGWALPGQLADHNSGSVVCSIAQLYLDATVVYQEPVVPHWDRSGINLSIYLSSSSWSSWKEFNLDKSFKFNKMKQTVFVPCCPM